MTNASPSISDSLRYELAELTASMCRALNDPKRLLIMYALESGPLSVSELTQIVDAPQSNVSQHLAVLRERGLVDNERSGNNVFYSLRDGRILDAINLLRSIQSDEVERRQALLGRSSPGPHPV